ncbi:MAG TPA: hypothetical protein VGK58_08700 [Lacipirellulaceae bacterium]
MLRYLRTVWSVLCLATCVLLIALWARSYLWTDQFIRTGFDRQLFRVHID